MTPTPSAILDIVFCKGDKMNAEHLATIREMLEAGRKLAEKDIRLYTSLGNQITPGEIAILAKAKLRLERITAALAALDTWQQGEWEPLPNGVYHTDGPEIIKIKDAELTVYGDGRPSIANLQQGYALCRTTPQEGAQL